MHERRGASTDQGQAEGGFGKGWKSEEEMEMVDTRYIDTIVFVIPHTSVLLKYSSVVPLLLTPVPRLSRMKGHLSPRAGLRHGSLAFPGPRSLRISTARPSCLPHSVGSRLVMLTLSLALITNAQCKIHNSKTEDLNNKPSKVKMNTDSGGCARKRAAMSVTLTSVKRVQSSPNLLGAGRDSQSPDSAWRCYNDRNQETLNGDATCSSLAAKGFRSVRPNLQEKKSLTQLGNQNLTANVLESQITVNGNSGGTVSPMSYYQRPFSPSAYSLPGSLNSSMIMQHGRSLDSSEAYPQHAQSLDGSVGSSIPLYRSSEEEKRVTVIKAPHYPGIGPVDESGIPTAIRTSVNSARPLLSVLGQPLLAEFGSGRGRARAGSCWLSQSTWRGGLC
ncbi:hypothetical protein Celaphus_00019263 [Cervus elaphus hippelaphus]|uniref:SoHo domain-containing protein n=1 Tax=Cervus elaphus hippelaphus TaxID=46360 RepID=A0A212C2L2_CEREH|nr:hypothetical protein Celaphus_00019263 [Cervus elaphus hippelaphus]